MKKNLSLIMLTMLLSLAAQATTFEFQCVHTRTTAEIAELGEPEKYVILTVEDRVPSINTNDYKIAEINQKTLDGGWLSWDSYVGWFRSSENELFVCSRPEF